MGNVYDENGNSLELGDALLFSTPDSVLQKGAVITDGQFTFSEIELDKGRIEIRATGYESYSIPIQSSNNDTLKLNDITMISISFDDVEIIAYKPAFKRDGDKIIVDVENSGMANSGTVIDLLRKSPGVLVDAKNNVKIFGRGSARIYIDGQLITSNTILLSIPSEEVKEIEVIKNPGAEYDAEGQGGVINIVTKSANLEGYSGTIYGSIAHGRSWFSSGGGRFNYKKKKISFYTAVNTFLGVRGSNSDYLRTIFDSASNLYFNNTIKTTRKMNNNSNIRVGLDYDIDSLQKIGIQWKSIYDNVDTESTNENIISDDLSTITSLNTVNTSKYIMKNNGINLRYKFRNDSTGTRFNASIDYTIFSSDDKGTILENIADSSSIENTKQSNGNSQIQLITGKLDYTKRLSKSWKLSLGAKHYGSSNSSGTLFQQLINNEWNSDSSLTSGYEFNENVSSSYLQTVFNREKLNARIGLRAEHTKTKGTSSITESMVIDTNYLSLFPSTYFGYKINKDLVFGFNYYTRYSRPRFQDLNPFVEYIDSVTAFIGNPFLLPEYSHNIKASLTFMEYASIELGYTRTTNEVLTIVERSLINNVFLVQDQNIQFGETYNAEITLPYETKKQNWTTYNGFSYSLTRYSLNNQGVQVNLSVPSFYFYLYNEVRLTKNISLQGTYWYSSKGIEGVFEYNAIYGLEGTITVKLLNDNLVLSLTGNDILKSYMEQGKSNLEGVEVQYADRYDTNFYRFSLRYNFGKLKKFDGSDRSGNREEAERIKSK